jgi:flagellar basal body-associated protein FliL
MARLIPLIGVALATLLIGGGAGWYFGNVSAPKTVIVAEQKPKIFQYPLPERIVNLADTGGRRYLKVNMVLEMTETSVPGSGGHASVEDGSIQLIGWFDLDETAEATAGGAEKTESGGAYKKELDEILPVLNDAVITVLSSKRSDQLVTNDGREGLRSELATKIDAVVQARLPKFKVVRVLFNDFIIQ